VLLIPSLQPPSSILAKVPWLVAAQIYPSPCLPGITPHSVWIGDWIAFQLLPRHYIGGRGYSRALQHYSSSCPRKPWRNSIMSFGTMTESWALYLSNANLYLHMIWIGIWKFFPPTDAQLDSLQNNSKFVLKLTLKSSYMFQCETPS
jgi:hypothetical protein